MLSVPDQHEPFEPLLFLENLLAQWVLQKTNELEGSAEVVDVVDGADVAQPFLPLLLRNNRHLNASELSNIADKLSLGGAHDGASLIEFIRWRSLETDPLLTAAVVWRNWRGGKCGFQFLPDPLSVDEEEDELLGDVLVNLFDEALEADRGGCWLGRMSSSSNLCPTGRQRLRAGFVRLESVEPLRRLQRLRIFGRTGRRSRRPGSRPCPMSRCKSRRTPRCR